MKSVVIGIGAGVGITPFLSLLEHLASSPLSLWNGKHVHVSWITRNPSDFTLGRDVLARLQEKVKAADAGLVAQSRIMSLTRVKSAQRAPSTLRLHPHVSRLPAGKSVAAKMFVQAVSQTSISGKEATSRKACNSLAFYHKQLDFLDTYEFFGDRVPLTVYFGRPEWSVELGAISDKCTAKRRKNIYVCGNELLVSSVKEEAAMHDDYEVEHERFGS